MDETPEPEWMRPTGRPWAVLEERLAYENPWIKVREYQAEAPTGVRTLYGVVGFRNLAIAILPVHEDGSVTLVGQHRFALMDYSWEVPEGGSPLEADPLEGARRELREETGLEASDWREVLRFQLSNSVSDERGLAFIATGLTQAEAEPDPTESLAIARVPFLEALEQALVGRIQDTMSVALLLRAYHMAREGHLPEPLARAMLHKAGETP
jgi:8-oxo-dGTP pyrophosphatase MutT (NUDIX family)